MLRGEGARALGIAGGSSYELAGSRVVRTFDTKYEARQLAKRAIRDAKLARLRAPKFANSVKAFARRIDATALLLDTEEHDKLVTAIYRLRSPSARPRRLYLTASTRHSLRRQQCQQSFVAILAQ